MEQNGIGVALKWNKMALMWKTGSKQQEETKCPLSGIEVEQNGIGVALKWQRSGIKVEQNGIGVALVWH